MHKGHAYEFKLVLNRLWGERRTGGRGPLGKGMSRMGRVTHRFQRFGEVPHVEEVNANGYLAVSLWGEEVEEGEGARQPRKATRTMPPKGQL